MRFRKKKTYFLGVGLFVFMSSFFVFFSKAEASSEVNFNQSILPVKFVYLNDSKEISDIWSNVKETDRMYVVKFFSEKNKKEIVANNKLVSEFKKNSIKHENKNLQTLEIDFIEKNDILEEVHTFV